MPKHGKNFRKALEGVNLQERLSVEDAVSKSLGASFAKFDETVDVVIRLGVDPKVLRPDGARRCDPASRPGQDRSCGRFL